MRLLTAPRRRCGGWEAPQVGGVHPRTRTDISACSARPGTSRPPSSCNMRQVRASWDWCFGPAASTSSRPVPPRRPLLAVPGLHTSSFNPPPLPPPSCQHVPKQVAIGKSSVSIGFIFHFFCTADIVEIPDRMRNPDRLFPRQAQGHDSLLHPHEIDHPLLHRPTECPAPDSQP